MWNIIATLLVLALVAGGSFEAYEQYGSGANTQSGQNLEMEVAQSIATMNSVYGGNADFSNLTNSSAYTDKIAPSSWTYASGSGFTLPEGGTARFAPTSVNGASTQNGYTLTLSNLKSSECSALGGYYTSSTVSVSVNGTAANNPSFGGGSATWPKNLASDCTAGGTNTIVFTQIGQ